MYNRRKRLKFHGGKIGLGLYIVFDTFWLIEPDWCNITLPALISTSRCLRAMEGGSVRFYIEIIAQPCPPKTERYIDFILQYNSQTKTPNWSTQSRPLKYPSFGVWTLFHTTKLHVSYHYPIFGLRKQTFTRRWPTFISHTNPQNAVNPPPRGRHRRHFAARKVYWKAIPKMQS